MLDRAEATQERVLELALGSRRASRHARAAGGGDERRQTGSVGIAASCSVAAAYALLLLVLAGGRPVVLQRREPARPRGEQRAGAGGRGRDDAGDPRRRDRHLGRLAVRVCGVVAGLLAKAGLPIAAGRPVRGAGAGRRWARSTGASSAALGLPSIVVTLATLVVVARGAPLGARARSCGPARDFQWFGLAHAVGQALIVVVALVRARPLRLGAAQPGRGPGGVCHGSDPRRRGWRASGRGASSSACSSLMGALAGLAALLNAVRFADVPTQRRAGLELQVIAAVVVGGTAITGGRGTLLGTLIGVLLLGTIGPALISSASADWEKAIQGLIILAALVADAALARLERHGSLLRSPHRRRPLTRRAGARGSLAERLFPNNEWVLLVVILASSASSSHGRAPTS